MAKKIITRVIISVIASLAIGFILTNVKAFAYGSQPDISWSSNTIWYVSVHVNSDHNCNNGEDMTWKAVADYGTDHEMEVVHTSPTFSEFDIDIPSGIYSDGELHTFRVVCYGGATPDTTKETDITGAEEITFQLPAFDTTAPTLYATDIGSHSIMWSWVCGNAYGGTLWRGETNVADVSCSGGTNSYVETVESYGTEYCATFELYQYGDPGDRSEETCITLTDPDPPTGGDGLTQEDVELMAWGITGVLSYMIINSFRYRGTS